MHDLKIGIVRDNGSTSEYSIDSEIINGLYSTTDNKKVIENIKNFNIAIEQIPNVVAQEISKINDVVIITILIDEFNKFQYLVGKDMSIDQLEKSNEIPLQVKPLIKDAYNLTKDITLGDLLK